MVSDGDTALRVEEKYKDKATSATAEKLEPALAKEFGIVRFDLFASIDRRNYTPMAGQHDSLFFTALLPDALALATASGDIRARASHPCDHAERMCPKSTATNAAVDGPSPVNNRSAAISPISTYT